LTTQTPIDPNRPTKLPKIRRVEVYWHTVTYKTVAMYISLGAVIIMASLYLLVPGMFTSITDRVSRAVGNVDAGSVSNLQTQAKFVNLDGKVQVKKVNSVQWATADYRTSLDKGDLVQTGSEGAARITFADGTTYTVKSDTLVTVEENSMAANKPTSVAMRINVGAVDLATPNWSSPNSKAAVSAEDTKAELRPNSRASVKNDPINKQSDILVSRGSAQVQRGIEKIDVQQWEKATIPTGGAIQKSMVLAPPDLILPRNLEPITAEVPKTAPLHFEWKPVPEAVSYMLRVSRTKMFTNIEAERRGVTGTSVELTGLDAGDYFWNIIATDAKKQTSEVSETFKFSLVAQGKAQDMMLEIEEPQIHGRVAEIIGRTEPGAALIINGQPVANIARDGTFRHFTVPLEPGQHTIVIIGQNRRGGTAQKQISIVVPK